MALVLIFSRAEAAEKKSHTGREETTGGHSRVAPPPESESLPEANQRGPSKWPKVYYQDYSRSQDGELQDAHFRVGFIIVPVDAGEGKRCLEVRFKLMAEITSDKRYYRDRMNSVKLFNAQSTLPGAGEPTPFKTAEGAKKEKAAKKDASARRTARFPFALYTPVYIALGKVTGSGELVVGCATKAGDYSGKVEVKAYPDSQEKMVIPWSFTFADGDLKKMQYQVTERAVYDPESFMGYIHPRRSLGPDDELLDMRYRFVGSSRYSAGSQPENYYQPAFPVKRSEGGGNRYDI